MEDLCNGFDYYDGSSLLLGGRVFLSSLDSPLTSDGSNSPLKHGVLDFGSNDSEEEPMQKRFCSWDEQQEIPSIPVAPTNVTKATQKSTMASIARVSQFLRSLSQEEKELIEAEGVVLPVEGPISKLEERELKRLRRKIKNKLSAQDSRRRRKEYMTQLEEENQTLKDQLRLLAEENKVLAKHMGAVSEAVSRRAVRDSGLSQQPSRACVMMMMLLALGSQSVPCAATDIAIDGRGSNSSSLPAVIPAVPQCKILDSRQSSIVADMLCTTGLANKALLGSNKMDCVLVQSFPQIDSGTKAPENTALATSCTMLATGVS